MISVIVPVYNVERYLRQCLDSICNQNYDDIEIICVNDGSTDGSHKILDEYSKKDSRIKIITQENHGLGHARNTGLNHVTGEYVLFVDSDDFLYENALEELYLHFSSNDSDVIIFNFSRFNENNNSYNTISLLEDNIIDYNNFTYDDIKQHVMYEYFAVWFKLYKKDFLDKFNLSFQVGIDYEDVLFQIKSFIYAEKMSFLPKSLYNYRVSNESSITKNNVNIFDIFDVVDSVEEFLKDLNLYDDFLLEFSMFKIIHIAYRFPFARGTNFFDLAKAKFFDIINNNNFNIDDFYKRPKKILLDVLCSNNLDEYLNPVKVSIILPVYNVENYLGQCLDSIISQDFKNFEIICVNDGSTDGSLSILEDYAKIDSRVKIVTQENHGLGHARNTGLRFARGVCVWFVDSDDFISKDSLNELYYNMAFNNSDFVIFRFNFYNEFNDKYLLDGVSIDGIPKDIDFNNFTFNYNVIKRHVMNTYIAAWSRFYKKEFLDKHNLTFQVGIKYEDVLFQIKSFLLSEKMSYSPNPYYNYRTSNTNSIMHNNDDAFDIIEVVDSVEKFLKAFSFFKEFEMEFYIFKIVQLSKFIFPTSGDNYFDAVRKEFLILKDSGSFDLDELPNDKLEILNNVINSSKIEEYFANKKH